MLSVCETFSSIQGESTHAGRRCFFIRLSGCSLRCSYCDTGYAREGGTSMSVEQLVEAAKASALGLAEITGGEPMEQAETPELCRGLLAAGLEVLLETNGAWPLDAVPVGVARIIDCKLPSSGMSEHNCEHNYEILRPGDEIKFVTGSREDFDFAVSTVKKFSLAEKPCELLVSPVWGKVDFRELAEWVMSCGLPFRMQLQMHKLIWGDRRGV